MVQHDFTGFDVGETQETAESISVGDSALSNIDFSFDQDWYHVLLSSGSSYTFDVVGSGASPLEDTFVTLYDPEGREVAWDDDSGENLYARLNYSPFVSASYYVAVSGYNMAVGEYELSVQEFIGPQELTFIDLRGGEIGDTFDSAEDVSVNSNIGSTIDPAFDVDMYRVFLRSEAEYTFDMVGEGADGPPLEDTYLEIYI
jgi:hypothetical protein